MIHVMLTIQGPNFEDVEEAELLRLPADGEPIETKYGTCVVVRTEGLPADDHFAARIVCRLP